MSFNGFPSKRAHDRVQRDRQKGCLVCKFLSRTVGRLLYAFTRQRWDRLEASRVEPHLQKLSLHLVGGLATRGWTVHDIDVIGAKADVPRLVGRLRAAGIMHPVHYCGGASHSHVQCIREGLRVLLQGDRAHLTIRRVRVPRPTLMGPRECAALRSLPRRVRAFTTMYAVLWTVLTLALFAILLTHGGHA
jgi:hypothetical protein